MLKVDPSIHPFFEVSWKISNICNYNCPYCVRVIKKDEEKLDYTNIAIKINKLFDELEPVNGQLYITGGEPFLWPIESLVDGILISPFLQLVRITSNMSLPTERYLKTRRILENNGKKFLLKGSLHQTEHDAQVRFIKKCRETEVDVINIVVNDDNYIDYVLLLQEFNFDGNRTITVDDKTIDINWMVERLTGGGVSSNVKNVPKKSRTFQISNEGCDCSAGITTIRVEPNGEVKRCASTESIGTLDNFQLPKDYYHCTRRTCPGCYNIWIRDQEDINFIHRFSHSQQLRGGENHE